MQHERGRYMAEQYITLLEAAELEGVKYNSMVQKFNRNKQAFKAITEKAENGGKERVLIAVSSLSKQARNAYKERLKLQELSEVKEDGTQAVKKEDIPWYVNADLEWYIENYKEYYFEAVEMSNRIRDFLQYGDKDRTLYAGEFATQLGMSPRTLYRKQEDYLKASAWASKMEKEDSNNYDFFKILSLARKPKATGMFPSFTPECKQVIKNIWFNKDFAQNRRTIEDLYDNLQKIADLNGWGKIPSYQSVTRYISYLMNEGKMANAHALVKDGMRDYKNKNMVKAKRDTTNLKVMEIIMGDEHTFDCWVAYKNPNGTVSAIKPKLVAWIDMRSRKILGDVMCKDANSDILKQSLLKLIYHDAMGVPAYLYVDNGKDYTSKEMTGVDRKDRRKEKADFDDVTKGFYKSIGIIDDHEALPYQPWSKGQIERFFKTVCNKFSKKFKSYTGTLTGSKTDAKVNKDIKRMLDAGELVTMEEFYQKWQEWLEKYNRSKHKGLNAEQWKTPNEVFANAERYEKAAPPKSYATMLMMKSGRSYVYQTGINKFGYDYMSDELCDYIDKTVDIKYDPLDLSTIYVFDSNGRKICEAYSQELLQITDKVTEPTLNHIKRQKRQVKKDLLRAEDATRPVEEINKDFIGFNPVTGGIELTISGPGRKKAKVVSMPQDRTYTQNSSMRNINDEDHVESDYMARNAENALKKLRVMNS